MSTDSELCPGFLVTSQNKQEEQNAALHGKGTCLITLTLVPSWKHHFTLTGKHQEDISMTKAEPPQNPTPARRQTLGQAVEEAYLVHNATCSGVRVLNLQRRQSSELKPGRNLLG